jgi:hypothetical protein
MPGTGATCTEQSATPAAHGVRERAMKIGRELPKNDSAVTEPSQSAIGVNPLSGNGALNKI